MYTSCPCPPGTIPTIPVDDCPVDLGQIQKMILQSKGYKFNPAGGANDITLGATWTALLAANDSTKVAQTPFIENFVIAMGEAITVGGGSNETLNGVAKITGVNPSSATGQFSSLPQSIVEVLKQYMCYKDLTAYFVNENGGIIAKNITGGGAITDDIVGFDIQSFFVSDLDNQGFATSDRNMLSFQLKKGWSDGLQIFQPADFDALNLVSTLGS